MNDQQKKCFEMVYNFIHDEKLQSQNLIAFIDICFKERDSDISNVLHEVVKPYLALRRDVGGHTMQLIYLLNESITRETMSGA